jgi:hypothetical protein
MPIFNKRDSKGAYFQFGTTGHKYYYKTAKGRSLAKAKCEKQMRAIEFSKHNKKYK